jgi:hypothetical protein
MPYIALNPADGVAAPVTTLGAPLVGVSMTLAEMRGHLNLMLGGRPDITNTQLDYWINAAYIDIASSLEIDELKGSLNLNLVVAKALYLLPKVVRAIRQVAVVDSVTYGDLGGRKLEKSDLAKYRRSSNRSDEPSEYFREKDLLVLYPTPTQVRQITLDIWIRPAQLVLDEDSPILPFEWHEVILKNARSKAHSDLREFQRAQVSENEFVNLVRRKDSTDELEEDDKIIGSSVPRERRHLYRRNAHISRDD